MGCRLDGLDPARCGLNEGRLAAGETLETPTGFLIASAANPLVDSVEKLEQKLEAGARCFQTNIVYDVDRFAEWFAPVVEAGVPQRAPVIVGVAPPRSTRMLQHMHDHIPGVEVDEATFSRLEGLAGDKAKAVGVEVAIDVVRRVRERSWCVGRAHHGPGLGGRGGPSRRRRGRPSSRVRALNLRQATAALVRQPSAYVVRATSE